MPALQVSRASRIRCAQCAAGPEGEEDYDDRDVGGSKKRYGWNNAAQSGHTIPGGENGWRNPAGRGKGRNADKFRRLSRM
ncbi:uncharacterized protein PHACADRAFT_248927 [Phanerochaete carnosa HHB-10118-sp]|uniref:Uncharacterized protein n=1 Tax=Phanerochaete carnosa (strain HHB-10118-sp) TaxID=650164 RepID=K5X7M2_PHACS|nr:uncharacterized protein PHACADRAFT_248927 [Phanerochaete carnosa HHB-10118-sp]EKM58832.1 hypothetical protein PHACADRAFT_248927 [Phanerochaete carnosa HHB-10118-sp]